MENQKELEEILREYLTESSKLKEQRFIGELSVENLKILKMLICPEK